MKVLVVDDCSIHRELMARTLGKLGIEFFGADSLKTAVLEQDKVDCLLVDVNMPDCSSVSTVNHFLFGLNVPAAVVSGVEPPNSHELKAPFFSKDDIDNGVVNWIKSIQKDLEH